jgi:phage regulator Rha-like protein
MSEYKIITKSRSEFQKLLNQWKHTYNFKIRYIEYFHEIDSFIALIERTAKTSIDASEMINSSIESVVPSYLKKEGDGS